MLRTNRVKLSMVQTRNLDQYAEIHRTSRYLSNIRPKLRIIEPWIRLSRPATILDYGAGQSDLVDNVRCFTLKVRHRYDPAIPKIATVELNNYDVVICTDVFEHFDQDEVDEVLAHIASIGASAIFCISTRVAVTVLPNGENAHATVRPASWWLDTMKRHFPHAEIFRLETSQVFIKTWSSNLFARTVARLMEWASE